MCYRSLNVLITIILLFFWTSLYPQGENNIWYLNTGLGVDFNTGTPEVLTDANLNFISYGVATVSDKNGDLLFYSQGRRIYDKNHNLMPNGDDLKAWYRAPQAVLAVPFPENSDLYYVFTHNQVFGYSVVDMQLNSGNGDVISSLKNILLASNLTYQQAAAKGVCGSTWVITHELNSNRFLVFMLTKDEISNPVISNVGSIHNSRSGQIKLSPDFTKLAITSANGFTELFDFNNKTGIVSNPIHLPADTVGPYMLGAYGVSFSPNGTRLYVGEGTSPPSPNPAIRKIFQYDISTATEQQIVASKTLVAEPDMISNHQFDLQLGPDSVIYVARHHRLYLGAIMKPNNMGISCDYTEKGIYFGSGHFFTEGGLPNPVVVADPAPDVNPDFLGHDTTLCYGQTLDFDLSFVDANFQWSDGSVGSSLEIDSSDNYWVEMDINGCLFYDTIRVDFVEQTEDLIRDTFLCPGQELVLSLDSGEGLWSDGSVSNEFDVIHSGTYWVKYINDQGCTIQDTADIMDTEGNIVELARDTTICDDTPFLISLPDGYEYAWQDGQSGSEYIITDSGLYWVESQNSFGCTYRDSINVNLASLSKPDLGTDQLICPSDSIILSSNIHADSYLWNTSEKTAEIVITDPGLYWLQVEIEGCRTSDTILIYEDPVEISLGLDTILCAGEELLISLDPEGEYVWQDGKTDQDYIISETGMYWVESQSGCMRRDSIQVEVIYLDAEIISTDSVICNGVPVGLGVDNIDASFEWITGEQEYYIIAHTPGLYSVTIENDRCRSMDSIWLRESNIIIDLGADTSLCESEILVLDAFYPDASYLWHDGSNFQSFEVNQTGTYWVEVSKDGCVTSDTIKVKNIVFSFDLGKDSLLCAGDELILDASETGATYLWQDGSTERSIRVIDPGLYWVEVTLDGCTKTDMIYIQRAEICVEPSVYIPNAFSPNGDGINDEFSVFSPSELHEYSVQIFDRWGELVYKTSDPEKCWDGIFKGKLAPTGVYVVLISYSRDSSESRQTFSRTLTLVR